MRSNCMFGAKLFLHGCRLSYHTGNTVNELQLRNVVRHVYNYYFLDSVGTIHSADATQLWP